METSTAISLIALVISGYTLYVQSFKDVSVTLGIKRVSISNDFYSQKPRAAFFLPILFMNQGAIRKVVEEIAVVVTCEAINKTLVFRPLLVNISNEISFHPSQGNLRAEAYSAIPVDARESLLKTIYFILHGEHQDFSWVQGDYNFDIRTYSSRKASWRTLHQFKHSISSDDIKALEAGDCITQEDGSVYKTWASQDMVISEVNERFNLLEVKP